MSYETSGTATARDHRYQEGAVPNRLAATPGTFPGIVERLEGLVKKAHAVKHHAENVREKIDGSRVPNEAKGAAVQAVRNGFIAQTDDLFAELERCLSASDDAMEHVWSKVS